MSAQLETYMARQSERRYCVGTFDCGTFAAGCLQSVTGNYALAPLQTYDKNNYKRLIAKSGGLEALITFLMNDHPVTMDRASNGSPVLLSLGDENHDGVQPKMQDAIGVFFNSHLITPNKERPGLVALPIQYGVKTWAVR